MAGTVNILGNQGIGVAPLTAVERLEEIALNEQAQAAQAQQEMIEGQKLQEGMAAFEAAKLRVADNQGVPIQTDNSGYTNAGSDVMSNLAYRTAKGIPGPSPANKSDLEERKATLLNNIKMNAVSQPTKGQTTADEMSPYQKEWVQEQFEMNGELPWVKDKWKDWEFDSWLQYGIPPNRNGAKLKQPGFNTEDTSGYKVLRGNLNEMASSDINDIVGYEEDNGGNVINVGPGGIQYQVMTNKDGVLGERKEMTRDQAVNVGNYLINGKNKLSELLLDVSLDNRTGEKTPFGRIIEQEFGSQAAANPALAQGIMLAWYLNLYKNRYDDYSEAEKAAQEEHLMQKGETKEELFSNENGAPKLTRNRELLEGSLGDTIEQVLQLKFGSQRNKEILSKGLSKVILNGQGMEKFSLMQNDLTYLGPNSAFGEGRVLDLSIGETPNPDEFPVLGVSFRSMHDKRLLGETLGFINALSPSWRKTAITTPIPKLNVNKRDPAQPASIKGHSTLLNWQKNELQGYRNKQDLRTIDTVTGLSMAGAEGQIAGAQGPVNPDNLTIQDAAQGLKWNTYITKVLKYTGDQINIANQQVPYVKARGGIFFNSYNFQASARPQVTEHVGMQAMPLLRVSTIPENPMPYKLSSGLDVKDYNEDEKSLITGAMNLLSVKESWNDGILKASDDLKYTPGVARRFEQLIGNPNHPLRRVNHAINQYVEAVRFNPSVQPEEVGLYLDEMMAWVQGKNDIQAIYQLSEFAKAKEANFASGGTQDTFLNPYVGAVDAQGSGALMSAVIFGDQNVYRSGGGRTQTAKDSYFHKDNVLKLEVEKMYVQAKNNSEQIFMNRIKSNPELMKFAELFFDYDPSTSGLNNFFQTAFVKRAVIGAIYGQGKPTAILTMKELFSKWLGSQDNALNQEAGITYSPEGIDITQYQGTAFQPKVFEAINKYYGDGTANPVIRFKPVLDSDLREHISPVIEIRKGTKADEMMNELGSIIHEGMHTASPLLQEYTKTMQNLFLNLVDVCGLVEDFRLELPSKLEMPSITPDMTTWVGEDKSKWKPVYDKNGKPNGWKEGISLNFLKEILPDEMISIPLKQFLHNKKLGLNEVVDLGSVYYQDPNQTPYSSLQVERKAKDWDDPDRPASLGITKWAVFTLHLADTATNAIAHAETVRKTDMDWYYTVWDEGKMDNKYREAFTNEYNKAVMSYLSVNNPIVNIASSLSRQLKSEDNGGVISPSYYNKIMKDPEARKRFTKVLKDAAKLQTLANEIVTKSNRSDGIFQLYKDHSLKHMDDGGWKSEKHQYTDKAGNPQMGTGPNVIADARRSDGSTQQKGSILKADVDLFADDSIAARLKALR